MGRGLPILACESTRTAVQLSSRAKAQEAMEVDPTRPQLASQLNQARQLLLSKVGFKLHQRDWGQTSWNYVRWFWQQ